MWVWVGIQNHSGPPKHVLHIVWSAVVISTAIRTFLNVARGARILGKRKPVSKKKKLYFEILIKNDDDIDINLNFARCSDRGGLRPTLTFRRRLEAELA